jgi:hypothetical protein
MQSLFSRIPTWADVRDYGADPTGVSDSTIAIQAAIDSGLAVYIPGGTYKITSPLILPNRAIKVYGDGAASIISLGSSAIAALTFDDTAANEDPISHIFSNFLILGESVPGQKCFEYTDDGDALGIVVRLHQVDFRYVEKYFVTHDLIQVYMDDILGTWPNLGDAPDTLLYDATGVVAGNSFLQCNEVYAQGSPGYLGGGGILGFPEARIFNSYMSIDNGMEISACALVGSSLFGGVNPNLMVHVVDTQMQIVGCRFYTGVGLQLGDVLHTGAREAVIVGNYFYGNSSTALDRCIDVLDIGGGAISRNGVISGNVFFGYDSEAIRMAGTGFKVHGNTGPSTGGCKVLETGSADNNEYDNLTADSTIIGPGSMIAGEELNQGRIQRDSATAISLQRFNGKEFFVRAKKISIPAAGMSRSQSDNLIDSTGADAGAATAINTTYYVYLSNDKASFSPSSIRLSTTAPSLVRGVKYLGASGNALNWRFIGWVRTISNAGTPNFADSLTQRFVINQYNPLSLPLYSSPGYVNDNAPTTYNETNGASYKEINGGVGSKLEFIANGSLEAIHSFMKVSCALVAISDAFAAGIGRSSATSPTKISYLPYGSTEDFSGEVIVEDDWTPAEGYQYLDILILVTAGGGGVNIVADDARNGAAADPALTFISALVMG